MSPQHPARGENPAAAAPGARNTEAPSPAAAPEEAPSPAAASGTEPGATRAEETAAAPPAGGPDATAPSAGQATTAPPAAARPATTPPAGEPDATPAGRTGVTPAAAGETAAAAPPAATTAETPEAPAAGIGLVTSVGTSPGTRTGTGVDGGRPRTPVLAAAAVVGAALIAIPLLLVGTANDDGRDSGAGRPSAEGADTVLDPASAPAALDDYVTVKPSASPSKKKPKKISAPKATVVQPAVPAPAPAPAAKTSSPAAKKKPEPSATPAPKAAPKRNWTSTTVTAPSTIEVNQAWTTNRIRMVMQPDGNLVVLNELGKPIWASMTFGPNHRAIFQPDGNLVIHNGDDRPIWASKTHDYAGARLVLRADAKIVVVHNGRVVWST
ncbi:mannose-binding protein [Streptomyces sp. NPDC005899]|uniref:mannose-binding protein n=1 Tax=Streptomyces sp. NPDC005899 TaxID=3155716 RepID=UPI0033EE5381